MSEEDVLSELRRQQVIATLEEEVTRSAPPVTEADVRRAFDERRATLASPERRHLRNLVVTTRAEADTVLRRVRAGADLGALAKQASLDESTRTKGGDLGFVTRDNLEQQYADVAFRTPRGEFFGPIKTRFGWNIGEVLNIERSQPRTFSVVKNDLRAALLSERRLRHWRDWLAEEIRDADVEYSDRYRPADPGAAPGSSSDDQSQQPPSPR